MAGMLRPDRREDDRPWGLIIAISLAIAIGAVGLPLQFATYNLADTASKEDLAQNREFLRRLAAIEESNHRDVEQHRVANSAAHAEQCQILQDIAKVLEVKVIACSVERYTIPTPSPSP